MGLFNGRLTGPVAGAPSQHSACLPICFAIAITAFLLTPLLQAQELDERDIKAGFVFNLTKYVEWPNRGSQLIIGFVGEGPMGASLKALLDGKTSESRVIHVVLSPADEVLDQCDVLYVGYASPKKVHEILERLRTKSVLTVSDSESFPRDGGMVALVRSGQQVQIQINLDTVRDARLRISSRVLNLATIVHAAPETKN
jgi:YfiR/HmsC-like